jgi:hypothetical protein
LKWQIVVRSIVHLNTVGGGGCYTRMKYRSVACQGRCDTCPRRVVWILIVIRTQVEVVYTQIYIAYVGNRQVQALVVHVEVVRLCL